MLGKPGETNASVDSLNLQNIHLDVIERFRELPLKAENGLCLSREISQTMLNSRPNSQI